MSAAVEKKRKAKTPEDVPGMGDPERKRVLNVLAQRRYRQRKREKIAALEAQAQALSSPQAASTSSKSSPSDGGGGVSLEPSHAYSFQPPSTTEVEELVPVEEISRSMTEISFPTLDFDQHTLDFDLFQGFELSSLPTPIPSTTRAPSPSPKLLSPSPAPQPFTFPLTPDANITIPSLNTLRAFSAIAHTLDLVSKIYQPSFRHVLPSTPHPSLPPNLHPTPAQITVPHHPLLDTLPWPSVREKLICMMAMPSALRPPRAQGEDGEAVWNIVHDLDDFGDGCRVYGNEAGWGEGNEMVEEAWEVGEVFFRNWWWCVDQKVIDISNKRRRERGAAPLRLRG